MEFKVLTVDDPLWNTVIDLAASCSWRAGIFLAERMRNNLFSDWERVIVALHDNTPSGFCTVSMSDCIPDVTYTPYIGFIFIKEEFRGRRFSQKLIEFSQEYLKTVGFNEVYIVSDHINLYEKYGFSVLERKFAPWGSEQKIYYKTLT